MKTLRDLQVGDEVIVYDPYSRDRVAQVAKITESHIYTDAPYIKYNINDGYEVGVERRWAHNIRVGSAEEIEKVKNDARRRCLSHYLYKFDWSKCDLDFLEGIFHLINSNGYGGKNY